MKINTLVFFGFILIASLANAGDMVDAETLKKLITDKTVIAESPKGPLKTFFSSDGNAYRSNETGTWIVKSDGTHCIDGIRGGCSKVSSNGDGTYTRGPTKWVSIVDGKSL